MADDDVRGTVTDSGGSPVEGATVSMFEHGGGTVVHTTTDANGDYVFNSADIQGTGPWHVTARWTDGQGNRYNVPSKPFVSATITANPTVEDFESYGEAVSEPGNWVEVETGGTIETDNERAFGALSLHIDGDSYPNPDAWTTLTEGAFTAFQPNEVQFVYNETTNGGGVACRWLGSGGQELISVGTANPQARYLEAGTGYTELIASPSPNYDEWRRFTITIDWTNSTVDILWEDLTGTSADQTATDVPFGGSPSDIAKVQIGSDRRFSAAMGGVSMECWVDDVSFYPDDGSGTSGGTYAAFWEDDPISPDRAVTGDGTDLYMYFSDKVNNNIDLRTITEPATPWAQADFESGWSARSTVLSSYTGTPKFDIVYQGGTFHMIAGTHGSTEKDYWTSSDGVNWTDQGVAISTADGDFPTGYDTMKRVGLLYDGTDWHLYVTANSGGGAETLHWSGTGLGSLSYVGVAFPNSLHSNLSSAAIGESVWYDSGASEYRAYVGGSDVSVGTHEHCYYATSNDGQNWTLGSNLATISDFPGGSYNDEHMYTPKVYWNGSSMLGGAPGASEPGTGPQGDPYDHDMSFVVLDGAATDLTYTNWYNE